MERQEAICECERYQGTNIGDKGKWHGSIEGTFSVGDGLGKKHQDYEKKSDT